MYTLLRLSRFVWLGCEVPRLKRIRRQLQCKITFCDLLWWRFLMPVVKLKTKVITLTSHVQLPHIIQWINRWIKSLQTKFERKSLRPSHTFVSSHWLAGKENVIYSDVFKYRSYHWSFHGGFPSSLVPLFQNEFKCETILIILMKRSSACSYIFMQIKVIFIRMVSHFYSLWTRGPR